MVLKSQWIPASISLLLAACSPTGHESAEDPSKGAAAGPLSLSCFNLRDRAEFVVGVAASWRLVTSDSGSPYYLASDGAAYFPQGGDKCRIVVDTKSQADNEA